MHTIIDALYVAHLTRKFKAYYYSYKIRFLSPRSLFGCARRNSPNVDTSVQQIINDEYIALGPFRLVEN